MPIHELRNLGVDFMSITELAKGNKISPKVLAEAVRRCRELPDFDVAHLGSWIYPTKSDEMLANELNNIIEAARCYCNVGDRHECKTSAATNIGIGV